MTLIEQMARAYWDSCGAMGPEVRAQTAGEGTPHEWELLAASDAIAEWNKREEQP